MTLEEKGKLLKIAANSLRSLNKSGLLSTRDEERYMELIARVVENLDPDHIDAYE